MKKLNYKEQEQFNLILLNFLNTNKLHICKENEQTEPQQYESLLFYELTDKAEDFFKNYNVVEK